MVIRQGIKCSTCGQIHTLRISLGSDSSQDHTFGCVKCGENIRVRLLADYKTISTEFQPTENCELSQLEGAIVNLAPGFAVPAEHQGKDGVFPSLEHFRRLMRERPEVIERLAKSAEPAENLLREVREGKARPTGLAYEWEFAGRVWSLMLNGQFDVCRKFIAERHQAYRYTTVPDPMRIIVDVISKVAGPSKKNIFEGLVSQYQLCAKNVPQNLGQFLRFYDQELRLQFASACLTVFKEYFDCFSEFNQVKPYVDFGMQIPSSDKISSVDFDRTKMFYGNAFELLTGHLVVPVCLDNLGCGRQFDRLPDITLAQYLKLDKAHRHQPLKNNTSLSGFEPFLNNKIRNASHHGSMKYDPASQLIRYKVGKAGAVRELEYAQYLVLCNHLTQTLAALLCFELLHLWPAAVELQDEE